MREAITVRHRDKVHHVVYSFALTVVGSLLLGPVTGTIIALAIGAAKELIWDWLLKRGHADWWDMVANCGGVAVALILLGR
jgi:hypothetical protein